ncbi:MAG: glycosyltransferase family 8 protein [Oscillospiraceae bacterium]
MDTISLLVTLDKNYLPQLRVMLTSLYVNNPNEKIDVFMIHRSIPEPEIKNLHKFCRTLGFELCAIQTEASLFDDAPVSKQYPIEMYYRLLAPHLLPKGLSRVLYLDPDILVINPLRPLWETDMRGRLFAAAPHTGKTELANDVNRIRLGTEHDYYNSGVILIVLTQGREKIVPHDIFCYAEAHRKELILPDQDILNGLYGNEILKLNDVLWNYDARNYSTYYLRSGGQANTDWVIQNTAILHFCGREKPWKPLYRHRFGILYKHYMRLSERLQNQERL